MDKNFGARRTHDLVLSLQFINGEVEFREIKCLDGYQRDDQKTFFI